MKPAKVEIEKAIQSLLHPVGFKKKGTTWYLSSPEAVCVFKLDKSPYGQRYSVSLGVNAKQLNAQSYPKVYDCHWYGNMTCTGPKGAEVIPVLELDTHSSGINRPPMSSIASIRQFEVRSLDAFIDVARKEGLPFLLSLQTADGIRRQWAAGRFRSFPLTGALIHHLGLTS